MGALGAVRLRTKVRARRLWRGQQVAIQNIADGQAVRDRGPAARERGSPGRGAAGRGHPHRHRHRQGIDTLATLPDGGVVTKANAEQFLTLAEWPG